MLESRLPRRARWPGRSDFLSVLVRTIPRVLVGVRRRLANRRALRAGRWHVEFPATEDHGNHRADDHLRYPHVRVAVGGGVGRGMRREWRTTTHGIWSARGDCR